MNTFLATSNLLQRVPHIVQAKPIFKKTVGQFALSFLCRCCLNKPKAYELVMKMGMYIIENFRPDQESNPGPLSLDASQLTSK